MALAAVAGADAPPVPAVSFRNHVVPVLTKMGCNSGACHGAAAGKNGFSLTLRGYDPAADYDAITRQAGGRRVNKLEPARSLLLLKPTEVVPHMGGKKFEPGSAAYDVLARWVSSGAPAPSDADARFESLDVTPGDATLSPGAVTPLTVRAKFSNGATEDVTVWSRFASADETVAQVDDRGRVTIKGPGETAVSVSFLTGVAMTRVRSPFPTRGARGDVCQRRAPQPHRRSGDRQATPDADPAVGAGRRCGVHATRVPRRGWHPADTGGGRGICGRQRA